MPQGIKNIQCKNDEKGKERKNVLKKRNYLLAVETGDTCSLFALEDVTHD